jgi:hypothetical protein
MGVLVSGVIAGATSIYEFSVKGSEKQCARTWGSNHCGANFSVGLFLALQLLHSAITCQDYSCYAQRLQCLWGPSLCTTQ